MVKVNLLFKVPNRPYLKQVFMTLIWTLDRAKFGDIRAKYSESRICAYGQLRNVTGQPKWHSPWTSKIVKLFRELPSYTRFLTQSVQWVEWKHLKSPSV